MASDALAQAMLAGLSSNIKQKSSLHEETIVTNVPPPTNAPSEKNREEITIERKSTPPPPVPRKNEKELTKREKIIMEIVSTEKTYCNNLQTIVSDYLYPIQHDSSILKKSKTAEIFGNIEDIMKLHLPMLHDLEQESKTQEKYIGEVFSKTVPYFTAYQSYCATYAESLSCLASCRNHYPKFATFLTTQKGNLDSLLIQPVQRIPRYRLLLAELLKNMDETSPDYVPTSKALQKVEEVAIFVNESVREKENQDKLLQIQQSLNGKQIPTIVDPDRKFIREGVLVKMCRRTPKRRYFYLFNDLLIYCSMNESSDSLTFHRSLDLQKVKVEDIPEQEGMENAFQLLSNQKSFAVFAESRESKAQWMSDIGYAKNFNKGLGSSLSGEDNAPVWVPDKLVKKCMQCKSKFTTLNRRHHCRKCGDLVCGSCSSKKYKLPNIGKQCRVCDICYELLAGGLAGSKGTANKKFVSTEKKQDLAKTATKKFQHKTARPGSSMQDFSGKSVSYSSLVQKKDQPDQKQEPQESEEKERFKLPSIPVPGAEEKYKPLPIPPTEIAENYSVPPPPLNEDGFFEYNSDDEELPPLPPRLPPPCPT